MEEGGAVKTTLQPRSLEAKPSLPVRIISPPQVVVAKSPGISDEIFKRLEERIRMLEESKKPPTESPKLPSESYNLTPIESKVLKAAYKCKSPEEICLKLMMIPSKVEKAINSLVRKGYLDRNLEPKIPLENLMEKKSPEIPEEIDSKKEGTDMLEEWRKEYSRLLEDKRSMED